MTVDLSFLDLMRKGSDAGLIEQQARWREWREMRNATSHAHNEAKAQIVAAATSAFAVDAARLLQALENDLAL